MIKEFKLYCTELSMCFASLINLLSSTALFVILVVILKAQIKDISQ